jgi:hypothetical protein
MRALQVQTEELHRIRERRKDVSTIIQWQQLELLWLVEARRVSVRHVPQALKPRTPREHARARSLGGTHARARGRAILKRSCNAAQHVATGCNAAQRVATPHNTLQRVATGCNAAQRVATQQCPTADGRKTSRRSFRSRWLPCVEARARP